MKKLYNDIITNADMTNEHFYLTLQEIANWKVHEGSGTIMIHRWALQKIAKELLFIRSERVADRAAKNY